jgi:hypothetical protein
LILDNADDISVFGDLWCNHFSGSIIVTTRNKDFDSSLEDTSHTRTSRFEVTPFENEESVKYLRKWAHPAGQAAADDQDLGRLSELLGGLPLAIVLASSYIRHTNKSISQYIDWFVAEVEKPIDLICPEIDPILQSQSISQHNVRYEYNPDPIPETVFTAFRISFEMVRSKDTAATQLLSLLSLYDDMDEVRGGVKNRTGAATELEDQASRFQSCLTYQLRYSFPEQLATFSEQQIKEGLDLLLDLSMVMLHYAATLMIQVPRQSKEVMQLIAQSSKNKMHGVLRPGIGVIA